MGGVDCWREGVEEVEEVSKREVHEAMTVVGSSGAFLVLVDCLISGATSVFSAVGGVCTGFSNVKITFSWWSCIGGEVGGGADKGGEVWLLVGVGWGWSVLVMAGREVG